MQATVSLALVSKAKLIFEKETQLLSFPLSPYTFSKEELDDVSKSEITAVGPRSDFSHLVNVIPSGAIWRPSDSSYLWEIYETTLAEADIASSTRSEQEETEYQDAIATMYETDEDGSRDKTDAMRTFSEYRDAWFVIKENYNSEKVNSELSEDARVKQEWRDVVEPTLRAEIEAHEQDWIANGFKREIEEALAKVRQLGAQSPLTTWDEWRGRFNPDIQGFTGRGDVRFMESSFTPANALDDGSWQKFTMD
ncbi:MAG: hypothetical protein AAF438_13550, partial [Pseudomonadota bacterium]